MCGIAGWYRRGGRPVTAREVTAQCDRIVHRGPDDSGVLVDGDFGFGMRRLSILDVPGGHQPMTTPDGRFSIVFNGEIYNHLAVRDELCARYPFTSRSDTETILAAFAAWGNAAWARLEGMFAVAIWDHATRTLTLARDPLGIKPLYFTEQAGGLAFGSELRTLRVLPGHAFTINDRAVHDYFSFGHVRRPRSIFAEVRMLDPGTFLTIGPDGPARTEPYWQPRFRPAAAAKSEAEWVEEMRSQLLGSTARHMQSDVPVGAFLSGGIDSSAVLAAMTRASSQPITAFTIGYPGARIDESDAAARIARHLGAAHVVLPLELGDATDILPAVLAAFDEPFADMAAIPTWYASKLAAAEVKVVLCGEGGDELFAGYKRHRNARAIERGRPAIAALRPLIDLADRLPTTPSTRLNTLRQHARRFAEFVRLPDGYQIFFAATQISRRALRERLYTPAFRAAHEAGYDELEAEYFGAPNARGLSALDQFLLADLSVNMPSAMLTRLDRASMTHSLEARVPLLSHLLVDWAMTVPAELKLRGTTGKYLLRQAIAPWLPPDILSRPKQGFQIPYADWFRGRLGDFARETWRSSGAADADYLVPDAVERLFDEHRRGEADHGRMLYAIAAFAIWWRDLR